MLKIPYFSQLDNKITKNSRKQSCGICCVKMTLDFLNPDNNYRVENLIKEATLIKAFDEEKLLWTHEGLVRILRNHGVLAYQQEFKAVIVDLLAETFNINENQQDFTKRGVDKIKEKIDSGKPVIVSVTAGFNRNKDDHMIIINGYEDSPEDSFYITDPQDEKFQVVTVGKFLEHWKKLAIFID